MNTESERNLMKMARELEVAFSNAKSIYERGMEDSQPGSATISRGWVKETAKKMTNVADFYKSLTQDHFLALVEANENYLTDRLREKGIAVEDKP